MAYCKACEQNTGFDGEGDRVRIWIGQDEVNCTLDLLSTVTQEGLGNRFPGCRDRLSCQAAVEITKRVSESRAS